MNRIAALQKKKWGQSYVRRVRNQQAIGEAIPNDANHKYAVGDYKLKFTKQAGNTSFGAMNTKNMHTCKERLAGGMLLRNVGAFGDTLQIGLPTRAAVVLRPEKKAKPQPRAAPAHPEPPPPPPPPVVVPRRRVVLATYGALIPLPGKTQPIRHRVKDMDRRTILECLLADGLPWLCLESRVYDIKCRLLHAPRSKTRHVGWHPEIIDRITWHPQFCQWLRRQHRLVARALSGDVVVPVFALWCNKGRHRSVAGAAILRYVLETQGVEVMTCHLAKDMWHRGACGGVGCPECTTDHQQRDRAFQYAATIWSES